MIVDRMFYMRFFMVTGSGTSKMHDHSAEVIPENHDSKTAMVVRLEHSITVMLTKRDTVVYLMRYRQAIEKICSG